MKTTKKLALSGLRFRCTGCGACCSGRGDYYVGVMRAEQRRIQRFLNISWRWFRARYIVRYADGTEGLRWAQERCAFLDTTRRCRIYTVRPMQCRTYPFWPEVTASSARWQREARHCEGIGRGAVIPLAYVRERLRLARK
jgi:uncharacterized protein